MKQLNQTEMSYISGAIDPDINATLLNSATASFGGIGAAIAGATGALLGGILGTGISKVIESQLADTNRTVGDSIIGNFEGIM